MTTETHDPALETLRAACAQAALPHERATVLSRSENVLYRLEAGIVARVTRPGQQAAARREVAVADWLEASGVPAVQTWPGIDQPVVVDDRAVTFWHELPPHRHGRPAEIATALRRLHNLPPPELDLGTIDPFVRLDHRIATATTISDDDRAWMRDHLTELRERWNHVPAGLPWCVVHGDAWGGNVVATDNGEVYLLDLERTSLGPPEWDTVHTAIKHHTFGSITDTEYRAFCDAYGHDVTDWAGYELLRDLREFRMTCMAAQAATENPTHREQADHRIACLRGKCGPRPWPGWRPIA